MDEALAGRLQLAELDYLSQSEAASRAVAENYAGLPFAAAQLILH